MKYVFHSFYSPGLFPLVHTIRVHPPALLCPIFLTAMPKCSIEILITFLNTKTMRCNRPSPSSSSSVNLLNLSPPTKNLSQVKAPCRPPLLFFPVLPLPPHLLRPSVHLLPHLCSSPPPEQNLQTHLVSPALSARVWRFITRVALKSFVVSWIFYPYQSAQIPPPCWQAGTHTQTHTRAPGRTTAARSISQGWSMLG